MACSRWHSWVARALLRLLPTKQQQHTARHRPHLGFPECRLALRNVGLHLANDVLICSMEEIGGR